MTAILTVLLLAWFSLYPICIIPCLVAIRYFHWEPPPFLGRVAVAWVMSFAIFCYYGLPAALLYGLLCRLAY